MSPSATSLQAPRPAQPMPADALDRLTAGLREIVGPDGVETGAEVRAKSSEDWSRLSPILQEKMPPGRYVADVVVSPSSPEEVSGVLALAHELEVPVTPRGSGTGNYGQGTPFAGGIVLNLRGCNRILEVGDGVLVAEAGALITAIDRAARHAGQDIWMYPSTKGTTIGGFIAGGSGGTGSIEHGTNADGFVRWLDVAACDAAGTVSRAHGEDAVPYIHAYGVSGIVTRVAIALEPAREWAALYAGFDSFEAAYPALVALGHERPLPRLASLTEQPMVETLPVAALVDRSRVSLRAIVETGAVGAASAVLAAHGGTIDALVETYEATDLLSSMSFNHPIYYFQQQRAPRSFHLALFVDPAEVDLDAVRSLYPDVGFHAELVGGGRAMTFLVASYHSEAEVLRGVEGLWAMGVEVRDPHDWRVTQREDAIRACSGRFDPKGLLNPGKLER